LSVMPTEAGERRGATSIVEREGKRNKVPPSRKITKRRSKKGNLFAGKKGKEFNVRKSTFRYRKERILRGGKKGGKRTVKSLNQIKKKRRLILAKGGEERDNNNTYEEGKIGKNYRTGKGKGKLKVPIENSVSV